MRTDGTTETLGDELLGHATPQRVQALDLAGLQGEGAHPLPKPSVQKTRLRGTGLQPPPTVRPLRFKLGKARRRPALRALGHLREGPPLFGRLRVHFHASHAVPVVKP